MKGFFPDRRIDSLGRVVTGKTPSTSDAENFGGQFPFITIPDLGSSVFVSATERTLSTKGANAIRSARLPAGSVMMSCIATVGKCGITITDSFTNQQINTLIPNDEIDVRFCYYAFCCLKEALETTGSGGATYTNVSKSRFGELTIPFPSLAEQREIAAILGALDAKVELNRKTAATLEEMARALYRSWFVDFDPVRAKSEGRPPAHMDTATAALFPDNFGEDGLPEGWQTCEIGALCQIKGGKQLSKDQFSKAGAYPVFGGAGEMGRSDLFNADGFVITVGRVGAYCGVFVPHRGKAWVNNNASHILPKSGVPSEFLFLALEALDLSAIKKGAAQPFISNTDLSGLTTVISPQRALLAFNDLVFPIFERKEAVMKENQTLATLRDTLLPRLMSGELRVGAAKELIEEVA